MHLHLSKELINNPFFDGDKIIKRYTVSDQDRLIGQFFYSPKECFFTYDDRKIKLHIRKNFFGLPKVSLIDEVTNEMLGEYRLTNWWIFVGYSHSLTMDGKIYHFKNISARSIFKKTWNQYKFGLSYGREEVTYTFKIDMPAFSLGNITPEKPFQGEIETTSDNRLLLLAGLYLVETALEQDTL